MITRLEKVIKILLYIDTCRQVIRRIECILEVDRRIEHGHLHALLHILLGIVDKDCGNKTVSKDKRDDYAKSIKEPQFPPEAQVIKIAHKMLLYYLLADDHVSYYNPRRLFSKCNLFNLDLYDRILGMCNLIFDIDGTLWNTTEIVAIAWQEAARFYGRTGAVITADLLKKEFGKTMDVIAEDIFTDVPSAEDRQTLIGLCCRYEHSKLNSITYETAESIIFPGVKDTLKDLASSNDLYIVSNCQKGYPELFTDKSGTKDLIKDHLCFGDTGTPKGDTIRTLMDRYGMTPEDTYYIGDTMGDFEACVKAGIRFIFCRYGFGEVGDPYRTIDSFSELKDMFL